MSGSGHNHSFNTILYNNKLLLQRRTIFKRKVNFHVKRQEYLKASQGQIDLRTASKKELLELRKKVIRKRRMSALSSWLITLVIIAPMVYLSIQVSSFFMNRAVQDEQEAEIQKQMLNEKSEEEIGIEKLNKYDFLLEDGDRWLLKGNDINAIHQYKNAVDLFPERFEANYKLALTYVKTCKDKGEGCILAAEIGEKLLYLFPNDERVIKLNQNFE